MNATATDQNLDSVLHEVVERLAPIDRTPCSPGEREAAQWLADRLRTVAGVEVALEDEPSWGTFAPTSTALGGLGLLAALLALAGRRRSAAVLVALGVAGIVDEAQNGPRIVRRLIRRRRETVNVVARIGEQRGYERTLVVIAHHDAPQTGRLFDQTLQRRLHERAPAIIEGTKTPPPQWWVGLAGPLLTLASAASGRRRLAAAGFAVGTFATSIVADIWRSETVQGANDNLSGVAALVGLAEMLAGSPLPGLRVLLVSCGAEETLQDGIRAFMARHGDELDAGSTAFVNLDTVGSPHLVMLEAEGPIWMEEYAGPWLRDLTAETAERIGVELHRGFRARASTDSVIPSRAGYAIATIVSMTAWRSPANYHLPSDVPANLDYSSVADATHLTLRIAAALAAGEGGLVAGPLRS